MFPASDAQRPWPSIAVHEVAIIAYKCLSCGYVEKHDFRNELGWSPVCDS